MNPQPNKPSQTHDIMKIITSFLTLLFGLSIVSAQAEARGDDKRGSSGGGKSAVPRSSAYADKRSPMTGSKIERPAAKPAPQPAARPTPKPSPQPATRPTKPEAKPAYRPEAKPAPMPPLQRPSVERPTTQPAYVGRPNRPEAKPAPTRPDRERPESLPALTRPGGYERPESKPMPRPDRPNTNTRPSTLPGMVTYPNHTGNNTLNRPNVGNGSGNNVNNGNIKIGNTYVTNVNQNRKNTNLNRPATLPANRRNWDNNNWGGNRGVWGNNNVNININNNFSNNHNYSYRPNYWGARPWWGASTCHTWHYGHWNYGYSSHYYHSHYYYHDDNFASGFMWGIAVWSLGNMIYDMGYQSYRNPYPAPPVQAYSSKTTINYTQPVSVTAAANPPGNEVATELAETKSAAATQASRTAFKSGDYVSALKSADEAIAYAPGDVTLHEYRALVLFALGRYSDAAGVLNPVLASGPGWGWDTMVGFYDSSATYTTQLRKLEGYVKGRKDAADGHFLLGYHYLVCGYLDKAYDQFDATTKLQPADSISRQLRDLTKSSLPDAGGDAAPAEEAPAPPLIPSEKLIGTWVSDRGPDGKVTFKMEENGDYTWNYVNGSDTKELKGTYGLNDKGLLVLTSDDSQMVSSVTLEGDSKLKFVLVGAPDGDPGLDFTKG